jgi:hypothetical protein
MRVLFRVVSTLINKDRLLLPAVFTTCIALVSIGLTLSGCTSRLHASAITTTGHRTLESNMEETEELKVYATLLDTFADRFGAERLLIINETTIGFVSPKHDRAEVIQFLQKRLSEGSPSRLVFSFEEKNRRPSALPGGVNTSQNYLIVEATELKSGGDWYEFDRKYPGSAIVQLSQVAFNEDMSHALVYLSSESGSRSGWAYYVVMAKKNENWEVDQKHLAWAS